ncbi:MAG: rod shape-determining protein MreC [Clostridiales bacterium]|nr:rod shape-determining protein MreC [Clostridiales bacterium]
MNSFFKGTTFKVLLTVAIILVAATVLAAVSNSASSPLTKGLSLITSPLQSVASYISEKFDDFTGGFVSSDSYRQRIAELEEEVAEYRSELVDYENTKKLLDSYEEFLKVREKNPDYTWVPCTIVGRDSADLFGSFTLNKGSVDGIEVNDAVIYSGYLIGVVTEVNLKSCVVRNVTDPTVNIAAYEVRTGEQGYVSSTAEQAAEGVCALSGLDRTTVVSKGGLVCTSGTGGIFPKDLIIGTVSSVEQSSSELSSFALIKPAVDTNDIASCFVITEFEDE